MTGHWLNFKNKKVFITGHTGFKGTWLLMIMNHVQAQVKGYSLPAEERSMFNTISAEKYCKHLVGDILDIEKLKSEILDFQPDYIFHLAAQPLVLDSYDRPIYTFEVNTIGTANILECIRQLDKKCSVVIVTTDKVYHNKENDIPFKENDHLGGLDPYSASKSCAEIVTQSYIYSFYRHQSQIRIATARAGNVIGGGDYSENRIVPDIVRALSNQQDIILRNPASIRPWQHVLDCLDGYVLLAFQNYCDDEFYAANEQYWNFGPGISEKYSVVDITRLAIATWGSGNYKIEFNPQSKPEAKLLQLDITKSNQLLNWYPKWDCKKSIEKTMQWYLASDKTKFTTSQITDFIDA